MVGQLVHFETRAVARLREKLGAAEETTQELIAFARGHSGAVASIHAAALAAIEAASLEQLVETIVRDWPGLLGIDHAALGFVVHGQALNANARCTRPVHPQFLGQLIALAGAVEVRRVDAGHPLFGASVAPSIRAEAVIRIDIDGAGGGLVVLGQCAPLDIAGGHGSELLLFLGRVVEATFRRVALQR